MNTRRNRRNGTMRKQRGGAMSAAVRDQFASIIEQIGDLRDMVSAECGGPSGAVATARPASARPIAAAAGAATPTRAVSRGRQPGPRATNDLETNAQGRLRSKSTGRIVEMQAFMRKYKAASEGKMNINKTTAAWKEYKTEIGTGPMTEASMNAWIAKKLGKKTTNNAAAGGGGGAALNNPFNLM